MANLVSPYVYKCTHKLTGRYYFGYRERNVFFNRPAHVDFPIYKTSCKEIQQDFDRYDWEILCETATGDQAYDIEQRLIESCWDDPLLINGNYHIGQKRFKKNICTEETKRKISKKSKGRKLTDKQVAQLNRMHSQCKGMTRTEETKTKMRKPKTAEHRLNIQKSTLGRIVSTKTRVKQSESKQNLSAEKRAAWIKNLSHSTKGLVAAYDIIDDKTVRITQELFRKEKGRRYVGINSKRRFNHAKIS